MLLFSDSASEKIAEYFKDKPVKPIRIFLQESGCAVAYLAMDLDEPKDTDDIFDIDGFKVLVDKNLIKSAEPITLDSSHFGFQIDCSLVFKKGSTACPTPGACAQKM